LRGKLEQAPADNPAGLPSPNQNMLERTAAPTAGLASNIMAPQILLRRCSCPLATLQRRQLTHRPKLYQPPADGQIVQWLRSTDRQSSNQFRERFGRTSLGQEGEPGRLFPRAYAEPLQAAKHR
jgi:hypothetical protein